MVDGRVVVTHWVHPDVVDELAKFCRPEAPRRKREVWARDEVLARARDAEGLVACMADRIDAELLAACPRLRVVSAMFKGHDNIDLDACIRRGVQVTVLNEMLAAPTAELAVALMLALQRRLVEGDAWVRSGQHVGWRAQYYGAGLAGACVGVIGMGRIGRAVAARLRGFGARLVYSDPIPLSDEQERRLGARRVELPELLSSSDVLVPLVPFTAGTRHLLDDQALARMRTWACVVNVARGSIVDERAIVEALSRGRLGGYAADVFEFEDVGSGVQEIPPGLLTHPRTIFTPHLGSAVDDVRRRMGLVGAAQIRQALAGSHPEGAITPPPGPEGDR